MSNKKKRDNFILKQIQIENKYCPNVELYKKNKRAYAKAWNEYEKYSKENVASYCKSLDYYDDMITQRAEKPKGASKKEPEYRGKKTSLTTARKELSYARRDVLTKLNNSFAPHFDEELAKLKEKHSVFVEVIAELNYRSPKEFVKSFETHPSMKARLKKDLKLLPFASPCWKHLALEPEQYQDMNHEYNSSLLASHRNAPSILVSQIEAFIDRVYKERKTNPSWTSILIMLYFCTGRRKCEILLADIKRGSREGHISLVLAKQKIERSNSQAEEMPIMFISVEQFFEMHAILIQQLQKTVFKDRLAEWHKIKETFDADKLDGYTSAIRDEFQLIFNLRRPKEAINLKTAVQIHKAGRSVYAQYAFKILQNHPHYAGYDSIGLANAVLGHGAGTLGATLSYLDVILKYDDGTLVDPSTEKAFKLHPELLPPKEAKDKLESLRLQNQEMFTGETLFEKNKELIGLLTQTEAPSQQSEWQNSPSEPLQPYAITNRITEKENGLKSKINTNDKIENVTLIDQGLGLEKTHSDLTEHAKRTKETTEIHPNKTSVKRKITPEDQDFLKKICSAKIRDAVVLNSGKSSSTMFQLQKAITVSLKRKPTYEELLTIAKRKDVEQYLAILTKNKIKHDIAPLDKRKQEAKEFNESKIRSPPEGRENRQRRRSGAKG